MTAKILTQDHLKSLLHYAPDTGVFTRRVTVNYNAVQGDKAGSLNDRGYLVIQINRVPHKAHRLAFLYMTGDVPKEVDHVNHIKDDNRWANLRPADRTVNNRNTSLRKDNASGCVGVHQDSPSGKWIAQINIDGRRTYLGRFDSMIEAVSVRQAAAERHGYHPLHGGARHG